MKITPPPCTEKSPLQEKSPLRTTEILQEYFFCMKPLAEKHPFTSKIEMHITAAPRVRWGPIVEGYTAQFRSKPSQTL